MIDPINEEILVKVHEGLSIRQIADLPGMPTRNAVHERLQEMERSLGLVKAPGVNNKRWTVDYAGKILLEAHGYIDMA
jgi:hypothetical protein